MALHTIKKGLDLPIAGAPAPEIDHASGPVRVALLDRDYPFMKPRMRVTVGDRVRRGQVLFEDRKTEGVRFTSPGGGTVVAVNRGARRAFQSIVVELSETERAERPVEDDLQPFSSFTGRPIPSLDGDEVRALLVESGQWTALRTRPYSKVPGPAESCSSIFVTAIDTSPLAADPEVVLAGRLDDFNRGLGALTRLTAGPVYLCCRPGSVFDGGGVDRVQVEHFAGPHPAGLAGTHIHVLDPVSRDHTVWTIGYQDVAAIGALFATGRLDVRRVVALGGPMAIRPRLLATRLGAEIGPLVAGELRPGRVRVVSGSVLHGDTASGDVLGHLGRYANQVSCLEEDDRRRFLGWLRPGFDLYSVTRAYGSALRGRSARYEFTTTTNGAHRAMVPIGLFERVMPLDILPTFLLRALLMGDLERAEALGCLELDEEDLALCTFVCPGKEDYGPALRRNLLEIWKEG
ncbi:MAG: Na(+)-translocating NADH-quinone reductase subunit A [Thermoanaerobaculales bacterium]|jgi:Na+-transporting NADH:ubiquinone oxidoreductase subunit A|nr:Na(+)-translocating NADH-quinone reductase subunit A [Thermoanaerobaculales bacterium]